MERRKRPEDARFWEKVQKTDTCWLWTGYTMPCGYGQFHTSQGTCLSHRWAYEHCIGPVPEGLFLDHLCRNRACVNPAHMDPTTNRENNIRGLRSKLNPRKSSQYLGVTWNRTERAWKAEIQLNGRSYTLGSFQDERKAHEAYMAVREAYEQDGTLPVSIRLSQKTSRYPGVYWDKRYSKWCARRQKNKRQRFLGYFDDEEQAHQVYLQAVKAEQGV